MQIKKYALGIASLVVLGGVILTVATVKQSHAAAPGSGPYLCTPINVNEYGASIIAQQQLNENCSPDKPFSVSASMLCCVKKSG